MSVTVTGDEQAQAVILRAGRRAQDQHAALEQAGGRNIVGRGAWHDRTGRLTRSIENPDVEATADTLTFSSSVFYAPFVLRGTSKARARPPRINERALIEAVALLVARDLIGQ